MKRLVILLLILYTAAISRSQTDCNCEQALNQLIHKIETEYPGFNDKTKDKILYNSFKERLLNKSGSFDDSNCIELLRSYKDFFRDGHISIYRFESEKNGIQRNTGKIDISPADFQQRILNTTDPLEGIWKTGAYKVGIVKVANEYKGFIIDADTAYWKVNEIKFRLFEKGKAYYYLRDHSLSEETWELSDGWILYFTNSKFIRETPEPNLPESEIKSKIEEIEGCYFKKVTDKTSLLCISSFERNYVERIQKLIADNKDEIENCENLIIDVRNNLGGVYDGYVGLLPYILTDNIRGIGTEFLATQTLIDGMEGWYHDEESRSRVREFLNILKKRMGEFVNPDSSVSYIDTIKIAERSPKQVIILVNRRTASSGEAFVLDAKQSKKVKIFGTPTYGALDYGTASFFEIGCSNYKLMMPVWRSMRLPEYPIDNIGIQPDIYLDKSVKDWIGFAVGYLEKQK
ncbi:MAG: S41 family peptidase [Ignavibacteria bacterium]|nr:S41 family peptidase [Ignavibacteria bacterium]